MAPDIIRRRIEDAESGRCNVGGGSTAAEDKNPENKKSCGFHAINLCAILAGCQRFRHVSDKLIDLLFGCGPRAHQPIDIWFDKLVETPAARLQIAGESVRHAQKHGARLAGKDRLGSKDHG